MNQGQRSKDKGTKKQMNKDTRSCLGEVMAMVGIIVAYFIYGFTLRAHDFYSSPQTRDAGHGSTEIHTRAARLTPDRMMTKSRKHLQGTDSFEFLHAIPIITLLPDSSRTYHLAWAIDCATRALKDRKTREPVDFYPQKIHIPAGRRIGLILQDGTEITVALQDSAYYVGVQLVKRGGTNAQRYFCQTDYTAEEFLRIRELGLRHAWIETEEGRIECEIGRMGRLELQHKMKQVLGEKGFREKLFKVLNPLANPFPEP